MKVDKGTIITSVVLVDMNDGKEAVLAEIPGSRCHFNKEFEYGEYIIQLRLDWHDVINGNPVLDADIWRKPKNKKNRLKNGKWHHTEKKFEKDYNRNVYIFEFMNLKLSLGTVIGMAKIMHTDFRCRTKES